ncbi:hypothetical protein N480_03160 [Pseudoalteromonas luteoviolacea S2607]|uniref:di-heme oxidoreductase family protein n=1 Tax=Pseudoalteromonas luteoviolacea TaxID=43657 RepID=UPI0007B04687|nr:di-heme oxidoredictase family protein [Pseudoalteromonas luteoviolacea]KZN30970.1 hypothetical protein N480_03160 [Pseudoalteromonas luteoviolacea S2607]
MNHYFLRFLFTLIFTSSFLTGCGGGSGGGNDNVPNNEQPSDGDNGTPPTSGDGSTENPDPNDGNQDSGDGEQPSNHAFEVDPKDGLPALLTDVPDENEYLSAGLGTSRTLNEDAFGEALPAVEGDFTLDSNFKAGDHIFRKNHDGQGPLFNNESCQGCHIRDGRGELPADVSDPMLSMFFRIGDGNGNLDPIYGDQIQVFGTIDGMTSSAKAKYNGAVDEMLAYGEAHTWVEYELVSGTFADGESFELRKPINKVRDLAYGPFMSGVQFSARVTPHVFGSGLLESIPEASILVYADEHDENKDGISGRAAYTTHPTTGEKQLARFGYKAVTGSVLQQASGAYRGDMGVTNSLSPEEVCTNKQTACLAQAEKENKKHHEGVDLNDLDLALVEFYNRTLAVPIRRGFDEAAKVWDEEVISGRKQFFAANCHSCHVPRHKTGDAEGSILGDVDIVGLSDTRTNITALENLVIYPYTDLLLHDMGGECVVTRETESGATCDQIDSQACIYVQRCEGLADGRPEGEASGSEWKTPALWGLGLVKTVNPRATFLHDGRARTISEAILWHGGEASAAKQSFLNMPKADRQALIKFLESL